MMDTPASPSEPILARMTLKHTKIAIGFAVVIVLGLALRTHQDNSRALMERSVSAIAARLPIRVDAMTTQTGVELGEHLLKSSYQIDATVATDPATAAAFRAGVLKQACAGADIRDILAMGYALDNVYTMPQGNGQFRVLIEPGDCG